MIKKIQEMNVATKLLFSFSIVIIMFFVTAVYSQLATARMDYLYRYRVHNYEKRITQSH